MIKTIFKPAAAIALVMVFFACNNDDPSSIQEISAKDIKTVQDFEAAEAAFADATMMAEQASDAQGNAGGRIMQCFTAGQGNAENQLVVTFDGTCTDEFGISRSGSLIYSIQGIPFQEGFQYSITFENYSRDNYVLNGTISSGGLAFNQDGNLTYSYTITNGSLEFPDESIFKMNRTLNYEWTEGLTTGDLFDNVFEVTGNSNGVNREGVSYTAVIDQPLVAKSACWANNIVIPVQGNFKITPEGGPEIIVDYGDGICDQQGTITVGSFTQPITF